MDPTSSSSGWPELSYPQWQETSATLHMWTQIVGKIRLAKTPWTNHSWHVTLYLTSRGLTTSPIYDAAGPFELEFDFVSHEFLFRSAGCPEPDRLRLESMSVAQFYRSVKHLLGLRGIAFNISTTPNEVAEAIPFPKDERHATYDPDAACRFFLALQQADRVFKIFRARFCGKCSPVHFFWGSFDLAVTRFSGRSAPPHPGGVPHLPDVVTREAYSHEVSSCGFWPGGPQLPEAVFYSYAYPAPDGFADWKVELEGAYFEPSLREFVLPYNRVRLAQNPDEYLLEFLQSTYDAASFAGRWDRAALEERAPA